MITKSSPDHHNETHKTSALVLLEFHSQRILYTLTISI